MINSPTGPYALMPPGSMIMFCGATAPPGFLLAQGQSLLRADYPALFGVLGTTYGSVDGTHFTLPDMQERFPLGKGGVHALGVVAGGASHSHTVSALTLAGGVSISLGSVTVSSHVHGSSTMIGALDDDSTHFYLVQRGSSSGTFVSTVIQTAAGFSGGPSTRGTGIAIFGNTDATTPTIGGSAVTPSQGAGAVLGSTDVTLSPIDPCQTVNYIVKF